MVIVEIYIGSALLVLGWSLLVRAPWRQVFVASACGPVTLLGAVIAVCDGVND